MKTLAEFDADVARKRAELEDELTIASLCKVTPDSVIRLKNSTWIIYRKRTLAEALGLFTAMGPPLDMISRLNSTRSIDGYDAREDEAVPLRRDDWIVTSGVMIDCRGGKSYGPEQSLSMFVRLSDGRRAKMSVDLAPLVPQFTARKTQRGVLRGRWYLEHAALLDRSYAEQMVAWWPSLEDQHETYAVSYFMSLDVFVDMCKIELKTEAA